MKTSAIALAAVIVAGLVAPSFAASNNYSTDSSFDADYILTQLQQKGVNASAVFPNGSDRVRAVVTLADGTDIFQYFDEETLRPVTTGVSNAVLTSLDTAQ
jgi:hypothetical protein